MRRSIRGMALGAACYFMLMGRYAGAEPDRVPFTFATNFETGEMFGWECYPYAQDIGWDPRTVCKSEPSRPGSKYSIARMVEPNDVVGLAEGFTRQIDLWTTGDTRMKFLLFLTADRKPDTLEMSICLFDGRRFFHTLKTPEANRWITLDIPLREFTLNGKPLDAGQHVQAVTIKATYGWVSDFISYTINLDDFSLNGERTRRFQTVDTPSTVLDMFNASFLHRHFYTGEPLSVTVRPEDVSGKPALTGVVCDVLAPDGKAVVAGAPLGKNGANWAAEKVYTFSPRDPRGQWRINFTGKDSGGREIRWGFTFIMTGSRITGRNHPRLFYSARELKTRLAEQTPIEKKILDAALSRYESSPKADIGALNEYKVRVFNGFSAGGPYAVSEDQRWRPPMQSLAQITEACAWRYSILGDAEAGKKGKEALLKLCTGFRMWTGEGWYSIGGHVHYPLGYITGPAAVGYDLLYPLLTEAERKTVRNAFVEKALKPVYRNLVEMNRMPSNLTNHIAVMVYGAALAATAIYGDDPADPSVEPWLSGILAKTKAFIDRTYYPDGGYGEPIGYQDMATRDLVQALDVLERNFGIDYVTTTGLKDTWLYPLYATYTSGLMPDFGDVSPRYNLSGNTYTWLSYRMKNPWTFDFVRNTLDQGRGGILSWLWFPKGVTPKSRTELVPSKRFPIKGNMVMRSGWDDAGSILAFRCGPNSNHYHYDQGTFYLLTNGEELLSDAGHGSSYYANLYYQCFYIQPIGHNTMLVDGNAESQWPADYENGVAALRDYPRILHSFAGWKADEMEGDLTCVYRGLVKGYTRSLLFMKPDILFLYDKVRNDTGHYYSWLFHAEHTDGKSSITYADKSLRIDRPKARLDMRVLAPEIASNRIRNSDRESSFITLTSPDGITDAAFLAVLRPSAIGGPSEPAKKLDAVLLKPAGWIGARVTEEDGETLALFRSGVAMGKTAVEGFSTDAERFAVETGRDGAVRNLFLRGAEFEGRGILLKSTKPVSASVVYTGGGMELEADAESGADITLSFSKAPIEVSITGSLTKNWKYDSTAKQLRVMIPAGYAIVKVK
ncbi:MAG: heparinase II/III domain-containing protein [Candidatus Latescibacterota bacterium]